ncbi:hypothetical protein ACJ6WF_40995 [Streptomyces sp. MMS24-I2-30]|uniref:hypothetical protein n=1 Tax=Streptomyces sp. MMS24-I2-30 TaxID=3351564 RepID=UPI003896B530
MPRRLRALLRQALTVHVPDPADAWRMVYDAVEPHPRTRRCEKQPPARKGAPGK